MYDITISTQSAEVALTQKNLRIYAEKNFHTQFSDKTAFLVRSWVGFEVEIAYALILTEHNKIVQKDRLYTSRDTARLRRVSAVHSQVRTEDNSYRYHVTAKHNA